MPTLLAYDALGHRTSHQTYYIDGRIKTSVDTFGQATNYSYDDAARHTIILDPLVVTTTKKSDKVGNLIEKTDSEGRTTKYDYDELNRQETVTDAVGGITRYTYDNNGKTTSILDAALNRTNYTYDEAERLTNENTILGNRIYTYDNVNNRISTRDRNDRTTEYTYDNLNRVKTETWVGGGKQFTYTYDQNSNLTSADDGSRHYDYTYDDTDLLMREDRSSATNPIVVSFKYDYDAVGNLKTTEELTAGTTTATTTYVYDPRNLNTDIFQSGAGLTAKHVKFTYDTQGQNTKVERYLGSTTTPTVTTDNTYDPYGRRTRIKQTKGSVTITDSLYGFDNLSRLISETKDGVNRLVSYDKIDQVKTVTGSNSEAYSYDANGNRTSGGNVPGVNNQLTTDGVYSYLYDGEGNRTSRTRIVGGAVDLYTWDYRNRLTKVVNKDAAGVETQIAAYEYDVDDQRVSKQLTVNNGQLTVTTRENYYLDGNQIAFVTDGNGNQTFHYLYGLNVDSVLAQDSSTGMVWALADRLGSIDTLTDGDGVVVDRRTFDSFGRVLSESNPAVSFRYGYTGRELDLESGLNYYRARYYDPANGRFISVDPAGFGAGDTNLYRYVGNNSTNATDPTGMWELPSWNDITQPFQLAGQFWGGVAAQGYNALTDNAFTHSAQAATEYYAGLAVQGQQEGGFWGGAKQVGGWTGGLLSSLATKDNIASTALTLASGGTFAALPLKARIAVGTSVGIGISSDLIFPNLLQAPTGRNDNATLPPGYELAKFAFELSTGFGIDKGAKLAEGFDNLLTAGGRKLGELLDGVPVLVDGFENFARNPTSLGDLFQPGIQSASAAINNAGSWFQHYFASDNNPSIPPQVPNSVLNDSFYHPDALKSRIGAARAFYGSKEDIKRPFAIISEDIDFENLGDREIKKFIAAVQKEGTVAPKGQSGVKILNPPMDGYQYELKIGKSSHRLLGNKNEEGTIIFDSFKDGGYH